MPGWVVYRLTGEMVADYRETKRTAGFRYSTDELKLRVRPKRSKAECSRLFTQVGHRRVELLLQAVLSGGPRRVGEVAAAARAVNIPYGFLQSHAQKNGLVVTYREDGYGRTMWRLP